MPGIDPLVAWRAMVTVGPVHIVARAARDQERRGHKIPAKLCFAGNLSGTIIANFRHHIDEVSERIAVFRTTGSLRPPLDRTCS